MDLMESFRTLRRRWVWTSMLLLLTLAGAAAVLVKLPWTYQSQAMTVLLPSPSAAKLAGGNPYLAFNQSLTLTADVVKREVMDPRTALALSARGYSSSYLIAAAVDTSGPVLVVTVTGSNKNTVEHTLHGVTDELNTKLQDLQVGLRPSDRIGSLVVSMTPKATRMVSKKARPLVVVLGLGLALTFAIPQIVDAVATRRQAQRQEYRPEGSGYPGDLVANARRRTLQADHPMPDRGGAPRPATRRSSFQDGQPVPDRADAPRPAAGAAKYELDPDDQAPLTRRLR